MLEFAVNPEWQLIIDKGGFTQAITRTLKDCFYRGHSHRATIKYFNGLLDGIDKSQLAADNTKKMYSQLNLIRRTIKDIGDTCSAMGLTETQKAYQAVYEKCVSYGPQHDAIYSQQTNELVNRAKQIAEDSPLKQRVGILTLLFTDLLILVTSIPFYFLNPIAALVYKVAKLSFGYTEEIISPSQWWQKACLQKFYPNQRIDELKNSTQICELHNLLMKLFDVPVIGEEQVRAFEEIASLNCTISPYITSSEFFKWELGSRNIEDHLIGFSVPEEIKPKEQQKKSKLISTSDFRRIIEAAIANPSCNEIWMPSMSNVKSYFENTDFQKDDDWRYKRTI